MTKKKETPVKKKFTPDWLVQGVLTKIGETFDKFTGRNWKPSSSLATSELSERLKKLLDAEAKEDGQATFVPHNIKLKTQWDKFSTDSEKGMRKLENELLIASIDHINDKRYHTYAPIKVEVKPDYFTDGVKLMASFEEFAPEPDKPEAEINVTIPQIKVGEFIPPQAVEEIAEPAGENYTAEFVLNGRQISKELEFLKGKRLSIGRTKENDLNIDDESISKNHASLIINSEGKLLAADTGSTNGTFLNNERISYGKAVEISDDDKLKFGNIEVFLRKVPDATPFVAEDDNENPSFQEKPIENSPAENGISEKIGKENSSKEENISAAAPIAQTEQPVNPELGNGGKI